MAAVAQLNGARLEFVVVPLEGKVKRRVTKWAKKDGLTSKIVEEPAGFMVYFPRGHALRIKDKATLAHYRLDRQPKIINIQGLNDPNSPVGQLISAQDDNARRGAMNALEKEVIAIAERSAGGGALLTKEMEAA